MTSAFLNALQSASREDLLVQVGRLYDQRERLREALRCTETALSEELKQIRRELAE